MRSLMRAAGSVLLALLVTLPTPATAQRRGQSNGPQFRQPAALHFEYLGPESSGRIAAVAGVPGRPSTFYLGAASGGVWKTTDGGETFAPIFDDQPVQAIGALAVAPSDPEVVWAGTGEAWAIRDADIMGDGVYRSTNGGRTWEHMGLEETGRIGRIIVHPKDPDVVYVCALGRTTGPQQERGVYRTQDGGRHWKRVLFVDPNTGCSGLTMDPSNPDVLFAGTWDVVMHTWVMYTGGPGSGLYVTHDGGDHWSHIQDPGLPKSPVGKIDVAIAPSNPDRVYALIQTGTQGSLWRSDDGGKAWKVVSWDRTLIGRAGYYVRLAVNPTNADEVAVMNSSSHRSVDGGKTFPLRAGGCGDCHDIWWDPLIPDHWIATGDGGAGVTRDHGQSFQSLRLPIGQMYHVAVDTRTPYWVYSNRQDDGTMRGPSDAPIRVDNVPAYAPPNAGPAGGRGGFNGAWGGRGPARPGWQGGLGGCESGFTLPDPTNPDIVWATCYANTVTRYDDRTGLARGISPWIHTLDSPPDVLKYRCHWTPPLAIDPFDPETVYYGCQVIFRTRNRGQSWDVISPDLSTQDSSRIAFSGGIPSSPTPHALGDNLGQFYGEVVFAIAPSTIERGLIWAGTNDGLIWVTRDGGDNWTNVTGNVGGLPEWGTIRRIEPSHFHPGTAYVTVDFHLMEDRDPYVYETTDYGKSWKKISDGLPHGHPLDYVMSVAENPNREGMLFAGTGHGFYYTMDDGAHWTRLQTGLPAAPVSWIVVEPRYHDVVISTYGRGLWALRDITRLEQSDAVAANADAFLYHPRPGIRHARNGSAEFLYQVARSPHTTATFEVLDADGNVIRSIEATPQAGLNAVSWDLRYDGPKEPALRTVAPFNPHIWEGARFKGRETRPIIHWGTGQPQRQGPIAAPGDYSVRVTLAGHTLTQPFRVIKDPEIAASDQDLAASTAAQINVRTGIDSVVAMTNRIEIMRKQIEDLTKEHADDASLTSPLAALDTAMTNVELRFLSREEMNSDDKWYVESNKLYLQYVWLSADLGSGGGDVQGGADYRPTDAQTAWLTSLEGELAQATTAYHTLMDRTLPAFNQRMAGKLPAITPELTRGRGRVAERSRSRGR